MKNKGVTIIEMVIVVIILILLAIIAIWSSKQPTLEAEAALYFSELKAVYTGILKIKQEYLQALINEKLFLHMCFCDKHLCFQLC